MIRCDLYDFVEIACMHGYPVRLTTRSGDTVDGKALDTRIDAQRRECIQIAVDQETRLVVLDTLVSLEVRIDNPHFRRVEFGDPLAPNEERADETDETGKTG